MFKKRSIQMKVVKDSDLWPSNEVKFKTRLDLDKINTLVTKQAINLAILGIGVYAAKVSIDTLSKIALNKTV